MRQLKKLKISDLVNGTSHLLRVWVIYWINYDSVMLIKHSGMTWLGSNTTYSSLIELSPLPLSVEFLPGI